MGKAILTKDGYKAVPVQETKTDVKKKTETKK